MKPEKLPIGYWLKRADLLLTKGIDNLQKEEGLNRTTWQVLNAIELKKNISLSQLTELMLPFADEDKTINALKKLIEGDFVNQDTTLSLTEKGKALHTRCLDRQQRFRKDSVEGISEEQYRTTIFTLQKLVSNLEQAKVEPQH